MQTIQLSQNSNKHQQTNQAVMQQAIQSEHQKLVKAYTANPYVKNTLDFALYEQTIRYKAHSEHIANDEVERRLMKTFNAYPNFPPATDWLDASLQLLVTNSWVQSRQLHDAQSKAEQQAIEKPLVKWIAAVPRAFAGFPNEQLHLGHIAACTV